MKQKELGENAFLCHPPATREEEGREREMAPHKRQNARRVKRREEKRAHRTEGRERERVRVDTHITPRSLVRLAFARPGSSVQR